MKLICDECGSEIEITKDKIAGAHPKPEQEPFAAVQIRWMFFVAKWITIILLVIALLSNLRGCFA